jgi:hypothetical protein
MKYLKNLTSTGVKFPDSKLSWNLVILLGLAATACSTAEHKTSKNDLGTGISSDFSKIPKLTENETPHQNDQHLDWPVDEARFTRGYSLDPTGKRKKPHLGIDLAAPLNTPIFAAHEGRVIYVGNDFKGFGRMVMIESSQGFATLYAHFNKIKIKPGQYVKKGQRIGLMGRSGRATGVHLHFEIRTAGGPVDPMIYLPNQNISKLSSDTYLARRSKMPEPKYKGYWYIPISLINFLSLECYHCFKLVKKFFSIESHRRCIIRFMFLENRWCNCEITHYNFNTSFYIGNITV